MLFGGKKQTVKIDGMKCMHCAGRVEDALKKLPGVSSAKVDLENKCAVIKSKNGITEEAVKTAVESIGFKFVSID